MSWSANGAGEHLVFPCRKWLQGRPPNDANPVTLWPDRDGDGLGDVGDASAVVEYVVRVQTSDERGAGTDANVFLEIFGDKGAMGEQRLDNAANNFERGECARVLEKGRRRGEARRGTEGGEGRKAARTRQQPP